MLLIWKKSIVAQLSAAGNYSFLALPSFSEKWTVTGRRQPKTGMKNGQSITSSIPQYISLPLYLYLYYLYLYLIIKGARVPWFGSSVIKIST
jgi:hypothetical protein